ncbi:Epimerase family protein [compost metagenome]
MAGGDQLISWIHIQDFCRALFFLFENHSSGIYNIGSPNPVTNTLFQKELRKSLRIPYFINQPVWMLKLGACFIGTETELVLKSRYVDPKKLIDLSFSFDFPTIESCFNSLTSNK